MLNDWKERRDDSREEQLVLVGLKEEFDLNLSEINRNIDLNQNLGTAINGLVELIRSDAMFEDTRKLDSLLTALHMFGSFNARTGFTDEIISSGKLSILRDQELKKQLTVQSSRLINAHEDYALRDIQYTDRLVPILIAHFPLSNADHFIDFSSWSESYVSRKFSKSPFEVKTEGLNKMAFENTLWMFKMNNDFVGLNEIKIKDYLTSTLSIINRNIQESE